jgi:hypothetical protein
MRFVDMFRCRSLRVSDGIAAIFFVAILVRHLQHGTAIFDIILSDDTFYLRLGSMTKIIWSHHEWAALFQFYYRVLAIFFPDPVQLYLYGGLMLMAACAVAVFVSLRILSGSPIFALIGTSLFIFSGGLLVVPKVSLFAIILLSAGLAATSCVRPIFSKCAILLLTAFLTTFVRPEYVSIVDGLAIVCIGLVVRELVIAKRGEGFKALYRDQKIIGWLGLVAVVVLARAWTFPIMRSDARALIAFAQHYAFRFVLESDPQSLPKLGLLAPEVFSTSFPGARSIGQAFRIAPALFVRFVAANAWDFVVLLMRSAQKGLPTSTLGPLWGSICLVVIATGIAISRWSIVAVSGRDAQAQGRYSNWFKNMFPVAVFLVPPVLACLLIYPREHYEVIVLYLLLAAVALCYPRHTWRAESVGATLIVGCALLIATPVVPRDPQTAVRNIIAIRQIAGIKRLFEADNGFCVYYLPPCKNVNPVPESPESLETALASRNFDSIILFKNMKPFVLAAPQQVYDQLFATPEKFGFKAYPLPSGHVLFKRQGE